MFSSILNSPIGKLIIKANDNEVYEINFIEEDKNEKPNDISIIAKTQLLEYFESKRRKFDFPIQQNSTDFQRKVWEELQKIPTGNTISYAILAKRLQNPLAIRAIAAANGKNKLLIVVPCHRVIGSNGKLIGFSAGLWRKKWLLEHESKITALGQSRLAF